MHPRAPARALSVLLTLLAAAALAGPAAGSRGRADAGAAPSDPCAKPSDIECVHVPVPLDRSGATPGSISLHVEIRRTPGVQRGTLFLVAGGPGQASAKTFSLGSLTSILYELLFPGYTLVAFDGRGTGDSGALDCPSLDSLTGPMSVADAASESAAGAACAAQLGPQRDFYGTGDQAEDIEAVREAIGVDRIAIWGTSYGTKVALAYAAAHPTHVERLLLDSVVPLDSTDPFAANVLRQLSTGLRDRCALRLCSSATPDVAGDLVSVANALAARPLSATMPALGGSRQRVTIDGTELLSLAVQTDLDPSLAAELPAAVRAARQGNGRPLLHLMQVVDTAATSTSDEIDQALYAATICRDGGFPWPASSSLADRPGLLEQAIASLAPSTFGPFGSWAAVLGSAPLCLDWPSPTGGLPVGSGPLPDVPVLALSGGSDLRTPTSDAAAVVGLFPRGHLLVVPGSGHSVLSDGSHCVRQAVTDWLRGLSVTGSCPRQASELPLVGAFPAGGAAAARILGPAQTLAVATNTVREAEADWLFLLGTGARGVAGVEGGALLAKNDETIQLAGYSIVPGVALSGTLRLSFDSGFPLDAGGKLTVTGSRASRGVLTFANRRASGTLAGTTVGR